MKANEAFFTRMHQKTGVSLNEVQKQAVLQTEGALLLLASPGSGKTTTIIMRIGYLIEEKGVAPSRIKAVTFSRASAADMKERFKRFFPDVPPVDFSTIHSLAFEVVREHYRKTRTAFQIIEGDIDFELEAQGEPGTDRPPLQKKLILRHLYQRLVGDNLTEDQMDELTTYISLIKNKLIPPEQWSEIKCEVKQAERILTEYEAFKRAGAGTGKLLLDYDDMLTAGREILERDRELLRRYQERYDYLLTDESQDTSMVQHAIIEQLVREHGKLCVVADDDQSIYAWRGAEPSYLLNFREAYPKAVILFMEQNYRSSKEIVQTANQFIKRNKHRYDKNMFTRNPAHKPIRIKDFSDYAFQVKYLVQDIQQVENLREVAVLYRNNSSSIPLMNELDRAGVPFYMKDADVRFFSHWVVKDMLNFMRMTYTDKRVDLLEEIYMKLNGYITKQQLAAVKELHLGTGSVFDTLLEQVNLQEYQRKPLLECKETFQRLRGAPPLEAIRIFRSKLGYEKAIERMSERLGFRKEYLIGILNTLEEIATTLETMEDFAKRLQYLESVMKSAKQRKSQNAVTLSTLHSAKGLEFQRVYMIDLIEGVIPSKEDADKAEEPLMEEAVRLFYVGMTRAKQELELLTYKQRDGEKVAESRFVAHVRSLMNPTPAKPKLGQPGADGKPVKASKARATSPASQSRRKDAPRNPNAVRSRSELNVGAQIQHRVFGPGEIVSVGEERLEIRFGAGVKVLSLETCLEMGVLEKCT
ncbi:ATP-dependent helicase [Paenibacillus cremeus]|uniref:DNA 3'-5' helicase n=1 Tax=Paenibacillus cremeus TaxID=2163881 RepID=A0A559KB99_9BACL|nr:ATP-dependent helicase [Paenibacillus cremeus]TVY09407.1 ATP-dependent helicase [Paenibacillus cremeus]